MEPKWDSVWDILSGALPVFLFWLAAACQNTTYSCCYSVAQAFIFILYVLWTLCAGGPFILPCLEGTSDDILGWYSYTQALILQKYILYFPWMSSRLALLCSHRATDKRRCTPTGAPQSSCDYPCGFFFLYKQIIVTQYWQWEVLFYTHQCFSRFALIVHLKEL